MAAVVSSLHAATVTTQLSADEVATGSIVQMQVRVDGSTNVVLPQTLDVDGLESALTGRSTQISIINGRMTASGIYTYSIRPRREGSFEIPALEINVDGRKERTAPQKLVVTTGTAPAQPYVPPTPGLGGSSGASQPSRLQNVDGQGKRAFAKLIIPKKDIYVGEVVPVEVQFYFASPFKPQRDPQVTGEGFTAQALGQPTHSQAVSGDVRYDVYTFKTSITAVKSGELQTPVASIAGILSIPVDDGSGPQGFFGSLLGGLVENRPVNIESESEPIRVKALPVDGRPANFSGAVGDFTIAATAQPARVAAGDPVTLNVVVSGRGNFDAMGDPQLVEDDGWRPYPPTSRFEKTDEVGYGGRKTYEMPMVAETPQTKTPIAEFSYFDPDKGKYFTIRSQPVAVEAAAAPVAESTAAPAAQPSATPAAADEGGSWLTKETKRSWRPVLKWPVFWGLNAAAALALVTIGVVGVQRRRSAGPAGRRAALIRQRDRVMSELAQESLSDDAFCAKALETLALQAQLAGRPGPFEFVRAVEDSGMDASDLHLVLGRADEIKFSGGNLASRLDVAERRRIAQAVREACK